MVEWDYVELTHNKKVLLNNMEQGWQDVKVQIKLQICCIYDRVGKKRKINDIFFKSLKKISIIFKHMCDVTEHNKVLLCLFKYN